MTMGRNRHLILAPAMAIVGSLLPAIAQASPATPPTPTRNPGLWISTDDYPASAERLHQQGIVGVTLSISRTGGVTACTVTQSSAVPLDSTTCDLLIKRATFNPARNNHGRPVSSLYTKRIKWQLTADSSSYSPPSKPLIYDSAFSLHSIIEKDGSVSQCTVDSSSGKPSIDFNPEDVCTFQRDVKFNHPYTDRNGNPVRMNIISSFSAKLVPMP